MNDSSVATGEVDPLPPATTPADTSALRKSNVPLTLPPGAQYAPPPPRVIIVPSRSQSQQPTQSIEEIRAARVRADSARGYQQMTPPPESLRMAPRPKPQSDSVVKPDTTVKRDTSAIGR